jgi:hypothetical protein
MIMKKLFPLVVFLLCYFISSSQLTVTLDNFNYQPDQIEWNDHHPITIMIPPEEGENMVWDYSDLTFDHGGSFYSVPLDSDSCFENASRQDFGLNQYGGNIRYMYELNDDGIVEVGFHTDYSVFPLGTGNPDDAVIWEEQCHAYYLPLLPLPMSYGDQSTHVVRLPHSQRTTITFASIIDQPSGYVQLFEQEKEVVGWGTVTIPDGNGASLSFKALLEKTTLTVTDSFYLNGMPTPESILTAFGLTQGVSNTIVRYNHRNQDNEFLTQIILNDAGNVDLIFFAAAPIITTSISNTPENFGNDFIISPNPSDGNIIQLAFDQSLDQLHKIILRNINGQTIHKEELAPGLKEYSFTNLILESGIYFIELKKNNGMKLSNKKLIIL